MHVTLMIVLGFFLLILLTCRQKSKLQIVFIKMKCYEDPGLYCEGKNAKCLTFNNINNNNNKQSISWREEMETFSGEIGR